MVTRVLGFKSPDDTTQVTSLDLGFSIYTIRLGTNNHHSLGYLRDGTADPVTSAPFTMVCGQCVSDANSMYCHLRVFTKVMWSWKRDPGERLQQPAKGG